jgi:Flp pilus assembly pilin Flp
MNGWKKRLCDFMLAEDGPTATEYGVLIAVICVAVISALSAFGDHMNNLYVAINDTMPEGW